MGHSKGTSCRTPLAKILDPPLRGIHVVSPEEENEGYVGLMSSFLWNCFLLLESIVCIYTLLFCRALLRMDGNRPRLKLGNGNEKEWELTVWEWECKPP